MKIPWHDSEILKGRIIMKDSKGLKNQNRKLEEQTPSPAVPNRAHTEMKSETKNEKSKGAESCKKNNAK